jgi:hypothetical protein
VPSSIYTDFSCLALATKSTTIAPALDMATRKSRANSPEFPILEANALYAGQIRGDGEPNNRPFLNVQG